MMTMLGEGYEFGEQNMLVGRSTAIKSIQQLYKEGVS